MTTDISKQRSPMTKAQLVKRVAELESALKLAADPAGYWCRSCGKHVTDISSGYRNEGHKKSCKVLLALGPLAKDMWKRRRGNEGVL